MLYRFPDNPCLIPFGELAYYDKQGGWMCQPKWDGWRRPCYLLKAKGLWEFHAKHTEQGISPPAGLVAELVSLDFPDGTAFDAEWMGPRVIDVLRGRHFFMMLDLLYWGGQWQGDVPCESRYQNMKTLVTLSKAKQRVPTPNIEVVDSIDAGFLGYFKDQRTNPLTEGVVIKHKRSLLKGDFRRPQDNPLWFKAKYR